MFIHNLKYALKTLFRSRMLLFWTFAFPIILATFFNMAFSNIENSEKLTIINIAIVDNAYFETNEIFRQAFKQLSDEESSSRLFNTQYVDYEEAQRLLKEDKITGYLFMTEEENKVIVNGNGMNETIFKYATEEIMQTADMVDYLATEEIAKEMINQNQIVNYAGIYQNVMEKLQKQDVKIQNISKDNMSYTMVEFYTLIAMTCLYGGILGTVAINQNLANMSANGKRVSVSPVSKSKMIFSSVLASYITQLIGLALLFVYTIFVLKINYGNNFLLILLLSLCGCLAGLTLGVAIGSILKSSDNVKTGVVISITMLGCFLSGMMGITMKYVIDKNMPILNKINPAGMITDGFYALYYYDTLNRYWVNVISLLIFAAIMIALSITSLRRQKYDSI
ncbi:MAG: ABC transporter permease [Clostridia bacterium]